MKKEYLCDTVFIFNAGEPEKRREVKKSELTQNEVYDIGKRANERALKAAEYVAINKENS